MVSKGLIYEQASQHIKDIYNFYLYNIHCMINILNYKYEWAKVSSYRFSNFGEYDVSDFSRLPNPFLLDYQNEKIKLAEDILENGMFFPFYGGKLENPINPELYFIIQGKHRLYALKRYSETINYLRKEFLFITYPIDVQYFRYFSENTKNNIPNDVYMYNFDFENKKIILKKINSYTDSLKIMDSFGTSLGLYLYELRKQNINIKAINILNNQEDFKNFISSPFNLELKEELL